MIHVETFCVKIWRDSGAYQAYLGDLDNDINNSIQANNKAGNSVVSIDTIDVSNSSHTILIRTITFSDAKDTTCQQL